VAITNALVYHKTLSLAAGCVWRPPPVPDSGGMGGGQSGGGGKSSGPAVLVGNDIMRTTEVRCCCCCCCWLLLMMVVLLVVPLPPCCSFLQLLTACTPHVSPEPVAAVAGASDLHLDPLRARCNSLSYL